MQENTANKTVEPSTKMQTEEKPLTYSEKYWLNGFHKNRSADRVILYVKKSSPKNKRRRQNEKLWRILAPKNALITLNEILMEDEEDVTYDVVRCPEFSHPPVYCAHATSKGIDVQGYGESKMEAKKAAAELAIKQIYSERLTKVIKMEAEFQALRDKRRKEAEARAAMSGDQSQTDTGVQVEPNPEYKKIDRHSLPMTQLAAFALYKLFSSWEKDGCIIPNFRAGMSAGRVIRTKRQREPTVPQKPRTIPTNASTLHPGFLLSYLHPGIQFKDVAIEATTPPSFTVSVEINNQEYIGKARNKKEARRLAAIEACQKVYGITFEEDANSNYPIWDEGTTVAKKMKTTPMDTA